MKYTIGIIIILGVIGGVFHVVQKEQVTKLSQEQEGIFKVGAILTETGPGAYFGEEMKNGMELANQDLKLDIVYEDSQTSPTGGLSAFNKLITVDDVDIIVPTFSSVSRSILPESQRHNIPSLVTLVSSTDIARLSELSFRYFTSGEQEGPILGELAASDLKLKRLATLYINDDYGASYNKSFKQKLESLGAEVVLEEAYQRGVVDFRAELTKMKGLEIDGVLFIGFEQDTIAFFKQKKELGVDAVTLSNWNVSPDMIVKTNGTSDGAYLTIPPFYLENKSMHSHQFIDKYTEIYNKAPSAYAAIGYDIVHILSLVRKEESPQSIISKLKSTKKFEAVMGDLIFKEDGDIAFPLIKAQIKDGKAIPFVQ